MVLFAVNGHIVPSRLKSECGNTANLNSPVQSFRSSSDWANITTSHWANNVRSAFRATNLSTVLHLQIIFAYFQVCSLTFFTGLQMLNSLSVKCSWTSLSSVSCSVELCLITAFFTCIGTTAFVTVSLTVHCQQLRMGHSSWGQPVTLWYLHHIVVAKNSLLPFSQNLLPLPNSSILVQQNNAGHGNWLLC